MEAQETRAAVPDDERQHPEAVESRKDYSDKDRQDMAKSGEAMPDGSFPIKNEADLKNAIQAYGRASDKAAAKAHIVKRARALGLTSLLPDGWEQNAAETEDVETRGVDPAVELRRARAEMLEGLPEKRRFNATDLEIRETSDGLLRFTGYASITERAYEVGDFEETISRGAFKRTLSESPDVVLLVNHGDGAGGLPLARTKSGTMTLTEDARGLRVDADLNPADPDVQALLPKMQRGDVDEMSFAFRVTDQEWTDDYSRRLVRSVALHKGDVSIVTYGANDASTGQIVARSDDGLLEVRAGKAISSANEEALKRVLDLVASADDAVDKAQPILAGVLGVDNPDADKDDDGDEGRSAEPEPEIAEVISLPEIRSYRERVARLKGARR